MSHRPTTWAALAGLLIMSVGSLPAAAAAQEADGRFAAPRYSHHLARGTVVQSGSRKEPVVAGLLSWVIPGVGSFYAGNGGHGVRHLVIHGVALGVTIAGAAKASDDISSSGQVEEGSSGLLVVGVVALVANGVWSIFTAVGDANAHNRASNAAFRLEPEVQPLAASSASGARVGLQVLRYSF